MSTLRERRTERMRAIVLAPYARWTYARKATVCMALRGGVVSIEEVSAAQGVPVAEIASWQELFATGGALALRVAPRRHWGRAA